ncbi:hypothetical protein BJV82DRAFT_579930 [Fennellomyces sp. T-0311]|nr:hypothetical protein BJV82DRAFT_579930 [Fennellomyces sp. T-0311]
MEMVQDDPTQMAKSTNDDRRVRRKTQHKTYTILEQGGRSRSRGSKCLRSTMAEQRIVPIPAVEVSTESTTEAQKRQSIGSSIGNTNMAVPVLVADGDGATEGQNTELPTEPFEKTNRMAVIKFWQTRQGLTEEEQDFLNKSVAKSTTEMYNGYWKKWAEWCLKQVPPYDPLNKDDKQVVQFLMTRKHQKQRTLNLIRSALASVFQYVATDGVPLAEQPLTKQFFQAKRKTEFSLPRMLDEIWDTQLVVDHMREWKNSNDLPLQQLQKKHVCKQETYISNGTNKGK